MKGPTDIAYKKGLPIWCQTANAARDTPRVGQLPHTKIGSSAFAGSRNLTGAVVKGSQLFKSLGGSSSRQLALQGSVYSGHHKDMVSTTFVCKKHWAFVAVSARSRTTYNLMKSVTQDGVCLLERKETEGGVFGVLSPLKDCKMSAGLKLSESQMKEIEEMEKVTIQESPSTLKLLKGIF